MLWTANRVSRSLHFQQMLLYAPEGFGIQPRNMLDVSRELTLEQLEAFSSHFVDWGQTSQRPVRRACECKSGYRERQGL
jgi:hypothetical protein